MAVTIDRVIGCLACLCFIKGLQNDGFHNRSGLITFSTHVSSPPCACFPLKSPTSCTIISQPTGIKIKEPLTGDDTVTINYVIAHGTASTFEMLGTIVYVIALYWSCTPTILLFINSVDSIDLLSLRDE